MTEFSSLKTSGSPQTLFDFAAAPPNPASASAQRGPHPISSISTGNAPTTELLTAALPHAHAASCPSLMVHLNGINELSVHSSNPHDRRAAIFERAALSLEGSTTPISDRAEALALIRGAILLSAVAARRHSLSCATTAVHAGVRLLLALERLENRTNKCDGISVAETIAAYRDLLGSKDSEPEIRAGHKAFDVYLNSCLAIGGLLPVVATHYRTRLQEILRQA